MRRGTPISVPHYRMPSPMELLCLVTLLICVGGCSSYKKASSPYGNGGAEKEIGGGFSVGVGDKVRVTLTDNFTIEGTITAMSPEALTIEPFETESAPGPVTVTADRILSLETWENDGTNLALLIGVVLGGLVLLGYAVAATGGL